MNNIDIYKLEEELKQGKIRNIYFLHGNDAYLFSKAISMITDDDAEIESLYLSKADGDEISAPLVTYFFGSRKYVRVFDLSGDLAKRKAELFYESLQDIPDNLCVIIDHFTDSDRVGSAPQTLLKQIPEELDTAVLELIQGDSRTINREIVSLLKDNGIHAERDAIELMKEFCDNDLSMIETEVMKLAAYTQGNITVAAVNELCTRTNTAWIYGLISSIESGRAKESLELLQDLFAQGMKPNAVLSIIADTYINIFNAKCAIARGINNNTMLSDLGIKYAKKYDVTWSKAKRFSMNRISDIINIIYETDKQTKSINVDPSILVTECVCKMLSVFQNQRY